MKLRVFESDMGDCLLLEADSGELVLCDGGMKSSVTTHVREELGMLREAGREIALIYISHIDNDHINGVLQLLEDEAEWRVFDFHGRNGDPIREPKVPRPPVINAIFHNSFRDMVPANNKAIENLLIASAPSLYATASPKFIQAAETMDGIAAGIPEALKVLRLVGADALDIPLNKPPGVAHGAKLLFAGRPGETFLIGSMKFTLIGPTKSELEKLKKGWNTWLKENPDRVHEIREELKKRIERFSAGVLEGSPYDLRDWNGIPDVEGVTAPNVASLMYLVEEDGKTLLLTGDAQQTSILDGLERAGFLGPGFLHLDVLKVQHHGSENNMDTNFARLISADHYVFCGNGSHTNPDTRVLDLVFESRLGKPSTRCLAPQAQGRDFHFWFSTTSAAAPEHLVRRVTFADMEKHVENLAARSGGKLHLHFNEAASIELSI